MRPTPLPDNGRVRVVGESRYQRALRDAASGMAAANEFDGHIPVTAALVPEPGNKWDPNAVRVDVLDGDRTRPVGYLPAELAKEYQPTFLELRADGFLGTCPGRIAGGGAKYYGIYLHLASPRELRFALGAEDPLVVQRSEHAVLLRGDRSCTVTKEEDHQDVLTRHAPVIGQEFRSVVASLDFCKIKSGKYKGRNAIEVRLDGHRVGQLTHAMSVRYGDAVRGFREQGLRVTCQAFTTSSPKGVQVELRLPPARS
ncbi:HIRAN domain-containing protein [Amycolatopsis sp. YIM 10]|uniref:HIRAN domain-containing protein n=1 Tax=Amycolatopsis sp. YIM 10 TaxID=2653857 RepID=UPI0012905DCA|nr:HIRAN domain-containing protein [Amycolatopsis sp. YIM 10]